MSTIYAEEGWFVLHLYAQIRREIWETLPLQSRVQSLSRVEELLKDFNQSENCQAEAYAILGHKADLGFMLIDPELKHLSALEANLWNAFPGGSLKASYSFVSMTEISDYISQDTDYHHTLTVKDGLDPQSEEYSQKMEAFRDRMQAYAETRVHPTIPSHKVMCFYPMNKGRGEDKNWYSLDFETRKKLMGGHLITGRKFQGKVSQLITGSVGLDDWEWGVTLFSHDPFYLKKIVYDMRFDEVSAVYGEFGEFLLGISMEPSELFEHLGLTTAVTAT